jgi:MSHA pilin protein MshD
VELVIFIVIISIAVVGILSVMNFTTSHSADPQIRKQALSIAEALMEEVSLAKFTYCDPADPNAEIATAGSDCHTAPESVGHIGPESGNARPYDNVNDYVAQYDVAQPIDITDVNGGPTSNLANYTATIRITKEALGSVPLEVPLEASLHIRIRVLYSNSEMVVLDGYRTRYAPNLLP